MNLAAYDKINNIIDKRRSWIDVFKRCIFTKETSCRNYVSFGKKYNPSERYTVYYVILSTAEPKDRPSAKCVLTTNGYIKISIKNIISELGLDGSESNYINIVLKPVKHEDDCDIYEIQFI